MSRDYSRSRRSSAPRIPSLEHPHGRTNSAATFARVEFAASWLRHNEIVALAYCDSLLTVSGRARPPYVALSSIGAHLNKFPWVVRCRSFLPEQRLHSQRQQDSQNRADQFPCPKFVAQCCTCCYLENPDPGGCLPLKKSSWYSPVCQKGHPKGWFVAHVSVLY